MKKIIYFTIAALVLMVCACTDASRNKLRQGIEQLNAGCPMNIGDGVTMLPADYNTDDNVLTLNYTSSEEYVTVTKLREADNIQRRVLNSFFSYGQGKEFLKIVNDADAAISIRFIGLQTGDTAVIDYTSKELKELEAAEDVEETPLTLLQGTVELGNAQCPIDLGEGLVFTRIALSDHSLEYYYSYDPELYDFSANEELPKALEEGFIEEMKQPGSAAQLNAMKELSFGVDYIFEPQNGAAPVIFSVSPETIKGI